ncbi:hypothetical protein ATKI12_0019 [Kitasatospora sp. Ki12]
MVRAVRQRRSPRSPPRHPPLTDCHHHLRAGGQPEPSGPQTVTFL